MSMLQILAHRGWWRVPEDRNSSAAIVQALENGFGVETDIRDFAGQVVVSHDPPRGGETPLTDLIGLIKRSLAQAPLALNVKSDGLHAPVAEILERHNLTGAFVFDMSIPDTVGYWRAEVPFFTRRSEYESNPVLLAPAAGIWLDSFESDWYDPPLVEGYLAQGKCVAVVSPELHGRDHLPMWRAMRTAGLHRRRELLLCTDHPLAAREFFQV